MWMRVSAGVATGGTTAVTVAVAVWSVLLGAGGVRCTPIVIQKHRLRGLTDPQLLVPV